MNVRRVGAIAALCSLVVFSFVLYTRAGLNHAYLAEDDFQWLAAGHMFSGLRSLPRPVGDGFYRPIVTVWFAGVVTACGVNTGCYHIASFVVHLLNISLVFWLAISLSRDIRIAFLATLLFALEPAYTQAVVWVSAATELLSTCFFLASLQAQVISWRGPTLVRPRWEVLAALFFGLALFCHEATVMLPIVAWLMWRLFGPESMVRRPVLISGLGMCFGVFGLVTMAANYRNPLIVGKTYRLGLHMIQHGLEYVVGLYVGPPGALAFAVCAVAIALLLMVRPLTRFGAQWLLITLLPYVGFTWPNVSRYSYLPSIGFSLAVGAAIVAGCDWFAARFSSRRPAIGSTVKHATYLLAALFIAIRFGQFDAASVRSQVKWTEEWRARADNLVRDAQFTQARSVTIAAPNRHGVDPMYIEPLLRWVRQDYGLTVVVE